MIIRHPRRSGTIWTDDNSIEWADIVGTYETGQDDVREKAMAVAQRTVDAAKQLADGIKSEKMKP